MTRPDFPNRCSAGTILILTCAGTALGWGWLVSDVTGGSGGAEELKLSRTRFVLGCTSDVGWDRARAAELGLWDARSLRSCDGKLVVNSRLRTGSRRRLRSRVLAYM